MQVNSVALAAAYSAILSNQNIDTNGPVGYGLSVGQTTSDVFELYGTLDAAAVDNTNAFLISTFTGGARNLPKDIADAAKQWPFLLVRRTGGATAGTFFAAGNPGAAPAVVSQAAPVAVGNYSAVLNLTTLSATKVRLGLSRQQVIGDSYDVFVSNDATLASLTGAEYVGRIYGGGGPNVNNTVIVSGYNFAIFRRVTGSTAGTCIAAAVSPSSGGGVLNLTTLAVGDTAANGPIGALTEAQTVDIYSSFRLTQTTAGITAATLPNPTDTTPGKIAFVMNNDTSAQALQMYGETLNIGSMIPFEWDGSAWLGPRTITQGGNNFGVGMLIGSTDNQAVSIQSGTGAMNVGTDAAAKTITIGNVIGATAVNVNTGTGGSTITTTNGSFIVATGTGAISIGVDAAAKTITIGNAIGATSVVVNCGTGAADFAANATDHTTRVGSATGVSATTVQAGTAGVQVLAAATGPASLTSGTTGAVSVDSGTTGNVNIGANAAGSKTIQIGSVTAATPVNISAGTSGVTVSTSGPITLGAGTNSPINITATVASIVMSGAIVRTQSGVATIADGTGSIGTALATVDATSMILVNQTTPVVLYANMRTIPAPTAATVGRQLTICNVGTAAFIIGDATQKQGINLIPGTTPGGAASANKGQAASFTWNGTAWVPDDPGLGAPVVAAGLADADASIPRAGRYTIYRMAALANNRTLTASLTGALIGDYIDIIRDDGANANTLTINNAAAAALCVMPASKKATARIAYLGTGDWQLAGGGAF